MNQFSEIILSHMRPLTESHKYGCVMAHFDVGDQQRFREWQLYNLKDHELHPETDDMGPFHITVKYGLHAGVSPENVVKAISDFRKGYAEAILGKIGLFPSSETGQDYEVVKVEVRSPDLYALNQMIIKGVECTDTHPVYKPHVTLAYLHTGCGGRFINDLSFSGKKFIFRTLEFNDPNDKTARIVLGGQHE